MKGSIERDAAVEAVDALNRRMAAFRRSVRFYTAAIAVVIAAAVWGWSELPLAALVAAGLAAYGGYFVAWRLLRRLSRDWVRELAQSYRLDDRGLLEAARELGLALPILLVTCRYER